jgi:hypothetical protein
LDVVANVLARAILQGYSKAVREIEAIRKRRLLVAVLAAIVGTSFASTVKQYIEDISSEVLQD